MMLDRLTKKERAQLKQRSIQVNLADNLRYKRKEIVFHTPAAPPAVRWVIWKMARVKGGKLKRLARSRSSALQVVTGAMTWTNCGESLAIGHRTHPSD
jgi:hypothetical protein